MKRKFDALKENATHIFEEASARLDPILPFLSWAQKGLKELKQSSLLTDFDGLAAIKAQIDEEQKLVEADFMQKRIKSLIEKNGISESLSSDLKNYEGLTQIDTDDIWDQCKDLLEIDYEGDKNGFNQDSWILFTDLKNKHNRIVFQTQ